MKKYPGDKGVSGWATLEYGRRHFFVAGSIEPLCEKAEWFFEPLDANQSSDHKNNCARCWMRRFMQIEVKEAA
jgi:hypothetical protein